MLPAVPRCPAASPIRGACGSQQGVVCRVMQRDIERDDGTELGMSAGKYGFLQHEATAGVYLNLKSDPSTVTGFCHGDAIPVVTDEEDQGRSSYTYCPVWQREKERIAAGREELVTEVQPEPVSMGVATHEAADPWQAARAGLDELVPAA